MNSGNVWKHLVLMLRIMVVSSTSVNTKTRFKLRVLRLEYDKVFCSFVLSIRNIGF
ncbi:hypothetical protein HanIR_Chr02g0080351 [Helianthus annuus]|nr:hypothetical protein HanIR_Chr02g0080351 [Helianthus annuus]